MQGARIIKRRIKTTKNIRQITKAMEMVSASKMKRAQQQAIRSKPYSSKLQESLRRLASGAISYDHSLLKPNPKGQKVIVLIGPDKGLTGGMITNLLKEATLYAKNRPEVSFITVGKKAKDFVHKMGFSIVAEFSHLPDPIKFEDVTPITKMLLDGYLNGSIQDVHIIYMDFISTLVQKARVNQILPIALETEVLHTPAELIDADIAGRYEYVFEPSATEILNWLLPYYVEINLYQTVLEAKASEHSARMVAMKNAKDNAGEIISDLTLEYNKSRQASITNELLDITTATYTS